MWWALYEVAGADPEPLETAEGRAGALKILRAQRSLWQHLGVTLMHLGQAVSEFDALCGQPDVDRASVVQRAARDSRSRPSS